MFGTDMLRVRALESPLMTETSWSIFRPRKATAGSDGVEAPTATLPPAAAGANAAGADGAVLPDIGMDGADDVMVPLDAGVPATVLAGVEDMVTSVFG